MEHVKGGFREEGRGTASLQGRAHYHCYMFKERQRVRAMLQSVVLKQASVQTWHTKQNDTHKRIPGTTVNIETYKYSLHWRQSWKVRHYFDSTW